MTDKTLRVLDIKAPTVPERSRRPWMLRFSTLATLRRTTTDELSTGAALSARFTLDGLMN